MAYIVRCECGRQLMVTSGMPGLTITCACGRMLHVDDGTEPIGAPEASDGYTIHFWRTLYQLTPRCFVTPALFWLNIAVFVAMVASGISLFQPNQNPNQNQKDLQEMVDHWGADYTPFTLGKGEYWRLLTCTFVHFGVIHLAFNVWALRNVGYLVERLVGNTGLLILYVISGVVGSLASTAWILFRNQIVVSAGASGAVFGVFGALFGFIVFRRDTVPPRILSSLRSSGITFIGLNLLLPLLIPSINIAGHLGGLAAGFCCGLALSQPVTLEARTGRPLRNLMVATAGALVIASTFLILLDQVRAH
jgi:rhomboid protease GluP